MYEKFTDRARKVMQLANQEAQRFSHEYVGTEHVLLGLIKESAGVAANVLKGLDIDLRKVRLEVEKLIQSGPDMVLMGKLPMTPRAKKVLELAMEAAKNIGHNYVGTEHILFGLVREQEGVAAQVLMNLGVTPKLVEEEIELLLGIKESDDSPSVPSAISSPNIPLVPPAQAVPVPNMNPDYPIWGKMGEWAVYQQHESQADYKQIVDEIKKILTESDISAMEQIRNIFNKGL